MWLHEVKFDLGMAVVAINRHGWTSSIGIAGRHRSVRPDCAWSPENEGNSRRTLDSPQLPIWLPARRC